MLYNLYPIIGLCQIDMPADWCEIRTAVTADNVMVVSSHARLNSCCQIFQHLFTPQIT